MTVAQLKRSMTTAEWSSWVAFYQLEADEKAKAARSGKRGG